MNDELKATIERLKDGTHSTADVEALCRALREEDISIASGERSAVLRDANGNVVVTGDVTFLLQFLPEELKRLLAERQAAAPKELAALVASRLHSLPSDIADFTGRKREVSELRKALEHGNGRIVISALNGMGGVGKTTLAIHVAHQLAAHYPEAQIVVDMQGTSQPLAPIEAMLRVIRAFHPQAPPADDVNQVAPIYSSVLVGKRVLILLDNAADAAQVRLLVPPAPCALIVTSRRRIKLEGSRWLDLDALSEKDARDLLREMLDKRRATNAQLDRLAELCGRLPLALRVAGTFLAVHSDWPVEEYIETLSDERQRLAHLKQDDFDVEAVLELSARQLEQESVELAARWRMLAVFPASFDLAAAAAVWGAAEARASLSGLFERSLLLHNQETGRYRLHDLVRLFVVAQLDEATRSMTQLRHAAHYCSELDKANTLYLRGGDALKQGLALFDLEWRNIRAGQACAAACAAEENQAAELCNRFPVAGAYLLDLRQHPRERIEWLKSALIAARQLKQQGDEGAHLGNLGLAYAALGETRRAIEFYEQQLVIVREIGDRRGEGNALGNLGLAYAVLGETRRAIEYHEQYRAIAREIGDRRGEGNALGNLGIAYATLGETRRAIEFYEQQLVIAREIGDRRGEGNALSNMSLALDTLGEREQAILNAEAALKIFEQIESPYAERVRNRLAAWRGQQ
jgi:tetratricopeptide (TPR) repeat protein